MSGLDLFKSPFRTQHHGVVVLFLLHLFDLHHILVLGEDRYAPALSCYIRIGEVIGGFEGFVLEPEDIENREVTPIAPPSVY